MTATRAVASSLLRASSRLSIPRTSITRRPGSLPQWRLAQPLNRGAWAQTRWQSQDSLAGNGGEGGSKAYAFEDIKSFIAKQSPDRVLVDTREPAELKQTGRIPSAINIPITSQPDSFFISAEEFEDRFGFERPGKGKEVVFYCKAGVRSRAAAQLARQAGWEKTGEYPGSWSDWAERGGEVEK